jgi:hypothetical protein
MTAQLNPTPILTTSSENVPSVNPIVSKIFINIKRKYFLRKNKILNKKCLRFLL